MMRDETLNEKNNKDIETTTLPKVIKFKLTTSDNIEKTTKAAASKIRITTNPNTFEVTTKNLISTSTIRASIPDTQNHNTRWFFGKIFINIRLK